MDERSRRTGYSRSRIDRAAERRTDADWLDAARRDAGYILFSGDRPLLRMSAAGPADPVLAAAEAECLGIDASCVVLLGVDGGRALFAACLAGEGHEPDGLTVLDVRSIAVQGAVAPEMMGPVAQAKSMLDWHARHRFCAQCGAPTELVDAGYRRSCPACGASHFPRTDPVAIMLVIDGDDCLLARSPRFQPGMYSALAGFVEPGETIEDAVRREVREEAGIAADRVAYHSSQPWPFPSSLMIGCFARAATRDLTLDRAELEAGRWFSRHEVVEMLNARHPDGLSTPPPMAIAHQLIKSFIAGETIF